MLRETLLGFAIGFCLLRGLVACGSPQLARDVCRLDALRVLPEDVEQVTAYDAIDLVQRLKACRVSGDAGR